VVNTRGSFIDTTVLISAAFPRERHHEEGRAVVTAIEDGVVGRPVFTDYILDELVTFIRRRKGPEESNEALDVMLYSPSLSFVKVEDRHFEAGLQLFRTYERLSLTDAVSVAVMRDRGIGFIFSFDSGFDGIPGITRITAVEGLI
jgi:predicted nucleic acid-binding protein